MSQSTSAILGKVGAPNLSESHTHSSTMVLRQNVYKLSRIPVSHERKQDPWLMPYESRAKERLYLSDFGTVFV